MPKYRVTVTETCTHVLYIEAPSAEAIEDECDDVIADLTSMNTGFFSCDDRSIEIDPAEPTEELTHFTLD